MKKGLILISLIFSAIFLLSLASAATTQQVSFNPDSTNPQNARFVVQTLKYEPYPVNAGDWFDLWVKVQNVGENDAKNAQFELITDYPFSSNDSLIRNYGLVPGTVNAYKVGQSIDNSVDANQVIMKFRVKASESAPEGQNLIRLKTTTDNDSVGITYSIPIEIGKTKSDFDIVMQDITPKGTSFVVTNTGQNLAKSVTLSIKQDDGISLLGPRSEVLGDLDKGDFTIAHLEVLPLKDTKSIMLEISYTDDSGTRSVIDKNIPIEIPNNINQICQDNTGSYVKWVYGVAGVFIGVILLLLLIYIEKKLVKK